MKIKPSRTTFTFCHLVRELSIAICDSLRKHIVSWERLPAELWALRTAFPIGFICKWCWESIRKKNRLLTGDRFLFRHWLNKKMCVLVVPFLLLFSFPGLLLFCCFFHSSFFTCAPFKLSTPCRTSLQHGPPPLLSINSTLLRRYYLFAIRHTDQKDFQVQYRTQWSKMWVILKTENLHYSYSKAGYRITRFLFVS